MYDTLAGILESLQSITNSTAEFKDLQVRIIRLFFSLLVKDPTTSQYIEIDKEFCDACDMIKLLKGRNKETVELGINFSLLLLHHEPRVTMSDLVGYDFEARDKIEKRQVMKIWESINDLGDKYNSFDQDLDKIITDKIDDEIEVMQKKFNKMLNTAISSTRNNSKNSNEVVVDNSGLKQIEIDTAIDDLKITLEKKIKNLEEQYGKLSKAPLENADNIDDLKRLVNSLQTKINRVASQKQKKADDDEEEDDDTQSKSAQVATQNNFNQVEKAAIERRIDKIEREMTKMGDNMRDLDQSKGKDNGQEGPKISEDMMEEFMNRLKEVEEKMKQSQNEGSEQIMEKLEN